MFSPLCSFVFCPALYPHTSPPLHLFRSFKYIKGICSHRLSVSHEPPQRVQLKLTSCQRKYQHNKPGQNLLLAYPHSTPSSHSLPSVLLLILFSCTVFMSRSFLSHHLFPGSFDFRGIFLVQVFPGFVKFMWCVVCGFGYTDH